MPSEGGLVYLTVKFIVSQEVLTPLRRQGHFKWPCHLRGWQLPPSDGRVSSLVYKHLFTNSISVPCHLRGVAVNPSVVRELAVTMPSEGLTATPLRWQGSSEICRSGTGGDHAIWGVDSYPPQMAGYLWDLSFGNWRWPCHLRVWQLPPSDGRVPLRSVVRELAVTMPSEGLTATPLRWQGNLWDLSFGHSWVCRSGTASCHTQVFGVRSLLGLSFGNCRLPYTSFLRSVSKISVVRSHKLFAFGQQDFCRSVTQVVCVRSARFLLFGHTGFHRSVNMFVGKVYWTIL